MHIHCTHRQGITVWKIIKVNLHCFNIHIIITNTEEDFKHFLIAKNHILGRKNTTQFGIKCITYSEI